VKLTPHGPDQAVMVAPMVANHGPGGSFGAGGMTSGSGCPDNMRSMSRTGPVAVILKGVWQSWQPPKFTRYLPRSIFAAALVSFPPPFGPAVAGRANAALATAIVTRAPVRVIEIFVMVLCPFVPVG
jgi:hypothetical protein